ELRAKSSSNSSSSLTSLPPTCDSLFVVFRINPLSGGPAPGMVRLVPRDVKFFQMFADMANNLGDGARLLKQTLDDFKDLETRVQKLKDIEHRGDEMTHNVLTKLNSTFITPFDREDIYRLASSLDDVLDFVYAAGVRLVMYKITSAPPAAARLAELIVRQSDQLTDALARLGKKHDNVLENCVEINRLENEADSVA